MIADIIFVINWIILFYFIIFSFGYLILLLGSIPDVLDRFKEIDVINIISLLKSYAFPPVTVIMSAYNEEEFIVDAIKSVLNNTYPHIAITIVNDGSTDKTLQKLIETFYLQPVASISKDKLKVNGEIKGYYISKTYQNITVIDKTHSDKSDSLNAALNACQTPLFICMDADTLLETDAISRLIFYCLKLSYPVAVGGSVYVLNGCEFQNGLVTSPKMSLHPLAIFQICEYLRAFLFSRSGWNALGGALCYSGAFTLINTHAAMDVGGYDVDNLAQDFEIITHLHEYKLSNKLFYHIGYTSAAVAWTDVPNTLKKYWHQRVNWQYYSLQSLMRHKRMLFNPKYGLIGLFTFPFYLFGEILGVLVEFSAYVLIVLCSVLGILDLYWVVLFFMICWGFSTFLTMATATINLLTFNQYRKLSDLLLIFFFSIIENLGFRQFSVLCRTWATFKYVWDSFFKK